jgi:hypothetical protein
MYIERLKELGHEQIYDRAVKNYNRHVVRYGDNYRYAPAKGIQIGNFKYSSTPEGDEFWRTLSMLGENRIDDMYDMFPEFLNPINNDMPYKVRINGFFTVK